MFSSLSSCLVDDFYLERNELWAIFASGTSPTIAGSVHIKRFLRRRSGRTADLPAKLKSNQACRRQTPAMVVVAIFSQVVRRHMRTRLEKRRGGGGGGSELLMYHSSGEICRPKDRFSRRILSNIVVRCSNTYIISNASW